MYATLLFGGIAGSTVSPWSSREPVPDNKRLGAQARTEGRANLRRTGSYFCAPYTCACNSGSASNSLGKVFFEIDTRHSTECAQTSKCDGSHCVHGVEVSMGDDDDSGGITWHTNFNMLDIDANQKNGLWGLPFVSVTKYVKVHLNGTGYVLPGVRILDPGQTAIALSVQSYSSQLAASGQGSAAATVDNDQTTCYQPEARKTTAGCTCLQSWQSAGQTIGDYCGNPDNDSGGEWCFVVQAERTANGGSCNTWGTCAPEERPHIVYRLASEVPDASSCTPANVPDCSSGCTLTTGTAHTLALSNGWGLNLAGGSDAFKLVGSSGSCSDAAATGTSEVTDLGPGDATSAATAEADVHFSVPGAYKACYRMAGGSYAAMQPTSQVITVVAVAPTSWSVSGTVSAGDTVTMSMSGGSGLDTNDRADVAKVVASGGSCGDAAAGGTSVASNLGSGDESGATSAEASFSFAASSSTQTYMVCYKVAGGSYVQVGSSEVTVVAATPSPTSPTSGARACTTSHVCHGGMTVRQH